jgi:hypothetical protein
VVIYRELAAIDERYAPRSRRSNRLELGLVIYRCLSSICGRLLNLTHIRYYIYQIDNMQLSTDVMDLILTDPVVLLLMSLTCRCREIRIIDNYKMGEAVAKYCDIATIEKLNLGDLFYRAIKFDRLDLLQLSHRRRLRLFENLPDDCSAILRASSSSKYPSDTAVCWRVARGGNLTMLKWCRENGYEWDEDTFAHAAGSGNLELLQYCRDNGCPQGNWAYCYAAENGHVDILQWLFDGGYPWNEYAWNHAVYSGHLDALKWLRANGCPWRADICYEAVCEGNIEILKWLRANGCDWNIEHCLEAAVEYEWDDIVEWINSQLGHAHS